MGLSTHILDTTLGRPAAGVDVKLEHRVGDAWASLGGGTTNADGRVPSLLPAGRALEAGTHRITFDVAAYFARLGVAAFYPEVSIVFEVRDASQHYHVPLLLNPFGYSTYRGS